jgi:hypothetical protein
MPHTLATATELYRDLATKRSRLVYNKDWKRFPSHCSCVLVHLPAHIAFTRLPTTIYLASISSGLSYDLTSIDGAEHEDDGTTQRSNIRQDSWSFSGSNS